MSVTLLEAHASTAQRARGTVLFADLRGYTALAERLDPLTVAMLLEEFFAILAGVVEKQRGTVFHLAGDTLMAGFGLTETSTEPVRRAFEAGRIIVESCSALSSEWERRHGVSAGVGVGLHLGELVATELGPPPVRQRTLIGDTVNVAARLCQRARAGEILFSGSIKGPLGADSLSQVIALPELPLRGRQTPVQIFCVPARERLALDAV